MDLRAFSWNTRLSGSHIVSRLITVGDIPLGTTKGIRNVAGYPLNGIWDRPYTYEDKNSDGFIVWTGGLGTGEGITSNAWNSYLTAKNAPWGTRAVWGMPMQLRDSLGTVAQVALGNATPDWHGGLSSNFSVGRFSAYGLLDAACCDIESATKSTNARTRAAN